jgi:quinolinate synthase
MEIKVREYRSGNQKWTIQRNWQHRVHKMKRNKTNTICVGHHYTQTNTNKVNKTTTAGKNKPNIVFMWISCWT